MLMVHTSKNARPRQTIQRVVLAVCVLCAAYSALSCLAQDDPTVGSRNSPERLEWFRDQGFGLFIHWSVDGQLGVVISHSLVGASDDYTNRVFNDLPKTLIRPASIRMNGRAWRDWLVCVM
jgi:alpha-L-fucosidase